MSLVLHSQGSIPKKTLTIFYRVSAVKPETPVRCVAERSLATPS